jgi:hypothetical protein
MLRKDCMTVKDRRRCETFAAHLPLSKVTILLRFVSKNEMDFNQISTGFSTVEVAISPPKMRLKRHRRRLKNSIFGSSTRPIMSSRPQPVIHQ